MTSELAPMAVAPACAPFHEYSLNEWSSSWPTSVTKPTFANLPPLAAADAGADAGVEAAAEAGADAGAADVPVDGADVAAGLAPVLLHAANATAAAASNASAARDEVMRMILLRSARPESMTGHARARDDRRQPGPDV